MNQVGQEQRVLKLGHQYLIIGRKAQVRLVEEALKVQNLSQQYLIIGQKALVIQAEEQLGVQNRGLIFVLLMI